MRLDSFAYRYLWRLKRWLRLYPGPHPIIWRDNVTRVLCPPDDLWPKLNEQETENLKNFQKEMAVLSKIFTYIPQQLSTKQWLELAKLDQFSERFDMVRFSRHLERKKQNREIAKLERASASVVRVSNPDPHKEYNLFQFVLHGTMESHEQRVENMRMVQAFQFRDRPTVAVDCRFLADHSKRGRGLTFSQLRLLLSNNRKCQFPWPIVFVNLDQTNEIVRNGINDCLQTLVSNNTYAGDVTSRSYMDLFERDRLIYLSPHTDEKLTTEDVMDERNVFIIGGIVDRVVEPKIHPQASLICAQEDGIRCKKLPLDDYVDWRAGKRFLTLTCVLEILQQVHNSRGKWTDVLEKVIPVRNKTTMKERNPMMKRKYEDIAKHLSEVKRIVREHAYT